MHKTKFVNMKSPAKRSSKKTPKKSLRTKQDIICAPMKPGISCEPFEDYQPSAGLFGEQDVEGREVFKVTPLKLNKSVKEPVSTGKLSERLSNINVTTPKTKTPSRQRCSSASKRKKPEPVTPGKLSQRFADVGLSTPKAETPTAQRYSMRQKMKQELANLKVSTLESDLEDSDENLSGEDVENDLPTLKKSECETPKRRSDKPVQKTFPETYFSAQKQKKTATSNRTLSSLKLERTDIEELRKILKNAPEYHKKEKDSLLKRYQSQFQKWKFLLHEGFNILLYGVGSKQNILNSFCQQYLSDALYVVVHGFFPSLNVKQILSSITEDALEYNGKFSNIYEHADYIKRHFSEGKDDLYLIFHNLDGMCLRNVKTQTLLSTLAVVPNIHFVASIDHINSPLMWDQIMLSHFKWVWFDVTNFEPYIIETSYENSIFKDQSSHLLLSSLLHVYHSLTPNGQGVFRILAKHQFDEREHSFLGIAFHEWYQECREAFLVNSEITMQAQLSEFKNHKLLTSRKSLEGIELWYIPVDTVTLEQFLESCK